MSEATCASSDHRQVEVLVAGLLSRGVRKTFAGTPAHEAPAVVALEALDQAAERADEYRRDAARARQAALHGYRIGGHRYRWRRWRAAAPRLDQGGRRG